MHFELDANTLYVYIIGNGILKVKSMMIITN